MCQFTNSTKRVRFQSSNLDACGTLVSPRLPPLKRAARLREVIAKLDASHAALFFFLAAQGRPRFTSSVGDLARKTNCSQARFVRLAEELAAQGLVSMHSLSSELVVWHVPEFPSDWPQPRLDDGKAFKIPGPRSGGRPRKKT